MTRQYTAVAKSIRVPPRKARLAAGLIRNKTVDEARFQLAQSPLKASRAFSKLLKSAVSNAEYLNKTSMPNLIIDEVYVNEGPVMKRAKSRSRGGRAPVLKRTSHFVVSLREGEATKDAPKGRPIKGFQKAEKPAKEADSKAETKVKAPKKKAVAKEKKSDKVESQAEVKKEEDKA